MPNRNRENAQPSGMSFTNAIHILQDMQEFLMDIRDQIEPPSPSSDGDQTGNDNSSIQSIEPVTVIARKPNPTSPQPQPLSPPSPSPQPQANGPENVEFFPACSEQPRSPIVDAILAIVRCTVCLEVPREHTYQCNRGHLVCEICLCYLINNARKNNEIAQCPTCRGAIRKDPGWRNCAIEEVAAELPSECKHCKKEFQIKHLQLHEYKYCPMRFVECCFKDFGCTWIGALVNQEEHHENCAAGKQSLAQIYDHIEHLKQCRARKSEQLMNLLCGTGVEYCDIELRPYVTLDNVRMILYDGPTFKILNTFWCISGKVDEEEGIDTSENKLVYRLIWKTPRNIPLTVNFVILSGPFSDVKVDLKVQAFCFTEEHTKTDCIDFPFVSDVEFVKQISNSTLKFRIVMSWSQ